MFINKTLTARMAGGKHLSFRLYDKNTAFKDVPALYVFLDDQNHALYIGQTTELGTRLANHHKWYEASQKGFSVIGVCMDVPRSLLEEVERELIQTYRPVCNDILYSDMS